MSLSFACCAVSIAPLRQDPTHQSEQTSQLLFGEKAEIFKVLENDWAYIRCLWDGYEGWCVTSQLRILQPKEYRKKAPMVGCRPFDKLVFEHGDMWLPAGSELTGHKGSHVPNGESTGKFKGKKVGKDKLALTGEAIRSAAFLYRYAPYLWGGRTVAGIDCSGLTQMAYKLCGLPIPRDAWQQAQVGEMVDFLTEARCGDLAFFDNEAGKIVHTGILLEPHHIMHATETSGRVVVDRIDAEGIISVTLKKRTHRLRIIRRLLPATN